MPFQSLCRFVFGILQALKQVGAKSPTHVWLMQGTEFQFALSCDHHGTFLDERFGGVIFDIVGCVSSPGENLPVGYVHASLICFVDEDHLGKQNDHSLVEGVQFGDSRNVSLGG